jgi:protein TonB
MTAEERTVHQERRRLEEERAGTPPTIAERSRNMVDSPTFFDFQVEVTATLKQGTIQMVYPPTLKSAGIGGEVLAQFVVDTDGRADIATFKVLKSTHELFTVSIRDALANAVFTPASVGGRPVKQLMQLPFSFQIK